MLKLLANEFKPRAFGYCLKLVEFQKLTYSLKFEAFE